MSKSGLSSDTPFHCLISELITQHILKRYALVVGSYVLIAYAIAKS